MILSETRIKEILIKNSIIDEDAWKLAEEEGKRLNLSPFEILLNRRIIDRNYFYDLLAKELNVPRVRLAGINIPVTILRLIPEQIAFEKKLIPFAFENDVIKVAMENPQDIETINLLEQITGYKLEPYLAMPQEIQYALTNYQKIYKEKYEKIIKEEEERALTIGTEELELSVIKFLDNLLGYAMGLNASDIHIEPWEDNVLIRFRVDGVLREIMRLPKKYIGPLIARVKVLSNLQLDEHFLPQDGRFKADISGFQFDIRVSIMPNIHGEKAVLRLLAASFRPSSFEELGMSSEIQKISEEGIKKTYGMILITGPTGSGKTTTLYTMLVKLNNPGVNICTIEDPVEYQLPGVNQTQVNPKIGLTFAVGLRAFLRQDPNIILVGEIRDFETADIAIQAALTGHLVLSTLHTNDAPTAVPRLIDLGVPPYLISASLNMVLAQRLVRKICVDCIFSEKTTDYHRNAVKEQLIALGYSQEEAIEKAKNLLPDYIYRGKGCVMCNFSGYRGRTGIFEGFLMDEGLRELVSRKDFTLDALRKALKERNFSTMFEDGLNKVSVGVTTLEEVLRVIRE
jgi:type IV pilus assembly protein PilB